MPLVCHECLFITAPSTISTPPLGVLHCCEAQILDCSWLAAVVGPDTHTHTCIHTQLHTLMHTPTCAHICIYPHTNTCIHAHTHSWLHLNTCEPLGGAPNGLRLQPAVKLLLPGSVSLQPDAALRTDESSPLMAASAPSPPSFTVARSEM